MKRARIYLDAIKFEHTLFALPFAYLGMILASRGWPGWPIVVWTTLAMAGARTGAMAANRLIDAGLDARNPRTATRAIPQGLMSRPEMLGLATGGFALLHIAAWQLNGLALALAPVAMLAVTLYSYTKRFTSGSHWILGLVDGIAPVGGWIAVTGTFSLEAIVLALAVMFWIGGFDVLYGMQDVEFDRQHGLHSIPARFGVRKALWTTRASHAATIVMLLALGNISNLGWPYWVGVGLIGCLLTYENLLLKPHDLSRLNIAFFNINGYIAIVALVSTIMGVWLD
ncbi:MAG TPA: 4-hydroxybenzoate octaprenyltransferase [Chloroflexi bacterium]|nr:4-hydroxybenzoate octaprenyltransferase [Chloroflexota bacterium]